MGVPKLSPCLIYPGFTNRLGYAPRKWKGKQTTAHRVAWIEAYGPILDGMHVLHHCDTRNCINVEHLFLGTHADNMADMKAKGRARGPRYGGSLRYNARLTDDLVREIRVSAETNVAWARRLSVVPSVISKARSGKTWRHLQEV